MKIVANIKDILSKFQEFIKFYFTNFNSCLTFIIIWFDTRIMYMHFKSIFNRF